MSTKMLFVLLAYYLNNRSKCSKIESLKTQKNIVELILKTLWTLPFKNGCMWLFAYKKNSLFKQIWQNEHEKVILRSGSFTGPEKTAPKCQQRFLLCFLAQSQLQPMYTQTLRSEILGDLLNCEASWKPLGHVASFTCLVAPCRDTI